MAMSSERFELSQDELESLLERVRSCMDQMSTKRPSYATTSVTTGSMEHAMSRARAAMTEAKSVVADMENEAKMAPMQYRGDMLGKVRHFREVLAVLQAEIRAHDRASESASASVSSSSSVAAADLTPEERYRRQVMEGARALDRTTQSIIRSQQVTIETEQVGDEIVSHLGLQRETLERTRVRLQETNAELSQSRKVLRRIYMGVIQNKIVLILIILTEIGIIGALIYWKFFL